MRRWLLALLILGAIGSVPLVLGMTGPSDSGSPAMADGPSDVRRSLQLVSSAAGSDTGTDAQPGASMTDGAAEGYELTINYRDSDGNAFTIRKPMDGGPASVEGQFSPSFWEQKLEPLLRSVAGLFKISVER